MESAAGIGTILLILIGGGVLVALRYVIRAALKVGNLASTVSSIIKKADLEVETTPKSLSSAEPLLMDRIKRDFPEYNPELIRQRVMKDAKTFYESAQAGKCLYADGISDQLRERLPSYLPPDVAGSIQVYKVALAAYDDASEDRVLTFQAAGYRHRRQAHQLPQLRRACAHRGLQGLQVLRHRAQGLGRDPVASDGR